MSVSVSKTRLGVDIVYCQPQSQSLSSGLWIWDLGLGFGTGLRLDNINRNRKPLIKLNNQRNVRVKTMKPASFPGRAPPGDHGQHGREGDPLTQTLIMCADTHSTFYILLTSMILTA